MLLKKLGEKQSLVLLGLNSGTSVDAVDMAAVRLNRSGHTIKTSFISGAEEKFPTDLRERILKFADAKNITVEELVDLDNQLGKFFGRAAKTFTNKLHKTNIAVDLIASHGQTVRHLPQRSSTDGATENGTLQLGSLEQIATLTGKPVVGDFRQADIALGNEGAPITVAAMHRLFSTPDEPRLIVNIGGISNFFYFPASTNQDGVLAADCGPGNCLCDILAMRLTNQPYDRNGSLAEAGKISTSLLSRLRRLPFFSADQVSTGRDQFGQKLANQVISYGHKHRLSSEDMLATSAELTVSAIVNSVNRVLNKDNSIAKLYLTGGGRKNMFFVERLRLELPEVQVCSIDDLGLPGDSVEAAAYAVMGEACWRGESLPTRFDSGRRQKLVPVLGKIAQPPTKG